MKLFCYAICLTISTTWITQSIHADGKVIPPASYEGSLEEISQEAIIIFHGGDGDTSAREDLILKISVEGDLNEFAWVVPFPSAPESAKEDAILFRELFNYCESRKHRRSSNSATSEGRKAEQASDGPRQNVTVISRDIVGSFHVDVVQEHVGGGLNAWLKQEGYHTLENAEDVLKFYREKQYVFACIKVTDAALKLGREVDLHPIRFSFATGGRDGIYFPMKMTGLQSEPFHVNLYVFYRYWLNDKLNKYGYVHRGFHLNYRDMDSPNCVPDGGKAWSSPQNDPWLNRYDHHFPHVTKLFQKLHPGERYYLTNIRARDLKPDDVRDWSDDLWMFPYYSNQMTPYDARPEQVASSAWPTSEHPEASEVASQKKRLSTQASYSHRIWKNIFLGLFCFLAIVILISVAGRYRSREKSASHLGSSIPDFHSDEIT